MYRGDRRIDVERKDRDLDAPGCPAAWRSIESEAIQLPDAETRQEAERQRGGDRQPPRALQGPAWTRRHDAFERFGAEGRGELGLQLAHRPEPIGGLRCDGALDDPHEAIRQVGTRVLQAHVATVVMRLPQLVEVRRLDREVAGDQVIEEHAQAVDVAPDGGLGAAEDLGRQIERRPRELIRTRSDLIARAPRAKVHEDEPPALFAHDVLRLDVAMHEAGPMDRRHRATEILTDEHRFACAERALLAHQLFERRAADEVHPEAHAAVVRFGAVHHDHVRMADAGENAAFAQNPLAQAAGRLFGLQELDRDLAVQLCIESAVDLAERAFADFLDQLQMAPRLQHGMGQLPRHRSPRWARRGDRLNAADDLGSERFVWRILVGCRAMNVRDARQNAQLADERTVAIVGQAALDGVPVQRGRAIGHGIHDVAERRALRMLHWWLLFSRRGVELRRLSPQRCRDGNRTCLRRRRKTQAIGCGMEIVDIEPRITGMPCHHRDMVQIRTPAVPMRVDGIHAMLSQRSPEARSNKWKAQSRSPIVR